MFFVYPPPRWFFCLFFTINSVFNLCQSTLIWEPNLFAWILYRFDNPFFRLCTDDFDNFTEPQRTLSCPVSAGGLVSLTQCNSFMNLALITEWFTKYHLSHKRLHSMDSVVHRSWKPPTAVAKPKKEQNQHHVPHRAIILQCFLLHCDQGRRTSRFFLRTFNSWLRFRWQEKLHADDVTLHWEFRVASLIGSCCVLKFRA